MKFKQITRLLLIITAVILLILIKYLVIQCVIASAECQLIQDLESPRRQPYRHIWEGF